MSNKENALAMLRNKVAEQNAARPATRRIVSDVASGREPQPQASAPRTVNEPAANTKPATTIEQKPKPGRVKTRERRKMLYSETVSFRVKLEDFELLESIADREGQRLSDVARRALEGYLETVRKQGPTK